MQNKYHLAEGLFEAIQEDFIALFKERFGNNYKSFFDAFKNSAEIKFNKITDITTNEFIRMVDLAESKLNTDITNCNFNFKNNKIIFYNSFGVPIAQCDCKLGWEAQPLKSKFDLTEDINEEAQYQITFPLIVTYDTAMNSAKDDIVDYSKLEQQCIEAYAKKVINNLAENEKYINEVLNIYDSEFIYDGYDDNFQIYFILKTKDNSLVDEQLIKAIRRYIDGEVEISLKTKLLSGETTDILLTAIPVVSSNANIIIKNI